MLHNTKLYHGWDNVKYLIHFSAYQKTAAVGVKYVFYIAR